MTAFAGRAGEPVTAGRSPLRRSVQVVFCGVKLPNTWRKRRGIAPALAVE